MRSLFSDFLSFIYKQAYACIFWGFLLVCIIWTKYYVPFDNFIYRYDFLFIMAVLFQGFLIATRLEKPQEVWIIAIFHIVAMGMEVFKTAPSIQSWQYPESFTLWIAGVPLFAGFMYSAVGSYIARVWRIFDFRYENYPDTRIILWLIIGIYLNFFTHHFIMDLRYILLIGVLFIFWKTKIYFRPQKKYYSMNLVVGFILVASVIWIAENIATYMHIWVYPSQTQVWHMVGLEKIVSWFLLMIISFVLVSLIHKPRWMDPLTK